MNYFELFGIPVAPTVNTGSLARTYFQLQKENHPDFHTRSSESEQEEALERSAAINKAFKIFQDKEKTLEYFLQNAGVLEQGEKYELAPDFLMEMMELNEEFGENGNHLQERIEEYEARLSESVHELLDARVALQFSTEQLERLKAYYYKKKYLKRILDRFDS